MNDQLVGLGDLFWVDKEIFMRISFGEFVHYIVSLKTGKVKRFSTRTWCNEPISLISIKQFCFQNTNKVFTLANKPVLKRTYIIPEKSDSFLVPGDCFRVNEQDFVIISWNNVYNCCASLDTGIVLKNTKVSVAKKLSLETIYPILFKIPKLGDGVYGNYQSIFEKLHPVKRIKL